MLMHVIKTKPGFSPGAGTIYSSEKKENVSGLIMVASILPACYKNGLLPGRILYVFEIYNN